MIGEKAPSFKAETTQGPINFPDDFKGKWVIFFSHPADFTPVCTTEFMTFASMQPEFEKLNCKLLGLSIDSTYSHIAWLRTIKEKIEFKGMKGVEVTFPVISDLTMEVSKAFGMLQPAASTTQAVRAVFIIDPRPWSGRSCITRSATAATWKRSSGCSWPCSCPIKHKVATPANWQPGEDVIVPPPGSCGTAKERMEQPAEDVRCLDWFMCLKKCPK